MKKTMYLLGGAPRVGKSIIARALMQEVKFPWTSTDLLRSIVRDITPDNTRTSAFPFSSIQNNDELAALSAEQITTFQQTEAVSLQPALHSFMDHQIGVSDYQILEGVHLLPHIITQWRDNPRFTNHIQVLFILSTNLEIQLESMKQNNSHFDWLSSASNATVERIAEFVVAYSKWLQKECDAHNIPYVVRNGDFDTENKRIIQQLTAQ